MVPLIWLLQFGNVSECVTLSYQHNANSPTFLYRAYKKGKTKAGFTTADLVTAREMDKNMVTAEVQDIPRNTMSLYPLISGEADDEDEEKGMLSAYL